MAGRYSKAMTDLEKWLRQCKKGRGKISSGNFLLLKQTFFIPACGGVTETINYWTKHLIRRKTTKMEEKWRGWVN